MEIGTLEIGGSIQTSEIERGLNQVESGFNKIHTSSSSIDADFERLNSRASGLANKFSLMALAGVTAMVGIAKNAPATAGAMAKMGITFGELTRSLGRALAPAFDVASNAFNKFVGWLEENEGPIRFFSETILQGVIDGLEGIKIAWNWISDNLKSFSAKIGLELDLGGVLGKLVEHAGPEVLAALIGLKYGGPWGALAGGAAMFTGRRIANPELYEEERSWGLFGGQGPMNPSSYIPGGMGIQGLIEAIINKMTRKSIEMSMSDNQ
jgi:hypothetical protein